MTRYATAKLGSYAGISAVGLLTALVTARPELVAVTAPFLLALGVGLALATPPRLSVDVVLDEGRALEGDEVGASPRGSLALMKLARCRAALDGRDYVTPDDVKSVAVPALAHRLTLRPELWVQRVSAEDVVRERLDTVPTPAAEDLARA